MAAARGLLDVVAVIDRDRVRGVLLGTALGDAAGVAFEGLPPEQVARQLARGAPRRRWVSDDTEQSAIVASALAESLDPDRFAAAMRRRMRRWFLALPPAIGWGTLRACTKLCLGARTGVRSAGNAPAMRAAVIGVVARDDAHLDALVAGATRITHTDVRAEDAARVVALAARSPWTLDELADEARTPELRGALAAVAAMGDAPAVEVARALGWERGVSAYCIETVPAAIWCSRRAPLDAIDAAVRLGGDTDTTAAIAGAIAGARAPHLVPTDVPWRRYLEALARAVADGAPPPRPYHPLLAVPRNLAVGAVFVGMLLRRLTGR
jgi:ADP-ribosylglycohydrolase